MLPLRPFLIPFWEMRSTQGKQYSIEDDERPQQGIWTTSSSEIASKHIEHVSTLVFDSDIFDSEEEDDKKRDDILTGKAEDETRGKAIRGQYSALGWRRLGLGWLALVSWLLRW